MPNLRVNSPDWTAHPSRTPAASTRSRGPADPQTGFPSDFLTTDSEVDAEYEARPQAATRARGATPGPLDVSYDLAPNETAVLAVRHPSGALTFHRPVEATSRSRGGPSQVRFVVHVPAAGQATATRGLGSRAVKAFIIKVAKKAGDALASLVIPKLVAHVEAAAWKKRGLSEGWLAVDQSTLAAKKLKPGRPRSTERSLLLIHGTFSNAAAAYQGLASSSFFARVAPLYGDRIFAFDHFSLSRTPEENVHMLLSELPEQTFTFDVITHSRGGLVLRNLVERAAAFGPLAKRFELGRAVLVASPNEGTPLATPRRWEDTVGWVANLLELFPVDNPFTTGAEFVANGIVWIARHASGDIPGLHSMDGDGDLITDLQQPPGPPADAYSALVSNYHPSPAELMRMVDAGFDQFFGSANDLVVPSEGGWRIDRAGSSFIPGARIGCFGPGGNLPGGSVTHVGFFAQPATVDFLVTALAGDAQGLKAIDPAKSLPDRRLVRAGGAGVSAPATPSFAGRTPAARRARFGLAHARSAAPAASTDGPPLRLTVVNGDLTFERLPLLIGHYQSTKLTGAEKVMNRMIGGAMDQALGLGNYPVDPGTHEIFLNQYVVRGEPWLTPRPQAVIVVGLGEEGSLKGAQLTHSLAQAVIAWARHVAEAAAPASAGSAGPVALEVATTLMASGGSGITPGQAAQLIAQGVYEANARLRAHPPSKAGTWPLVTHLRLVEIYLDRASEAWRALKMHTEATSGRYVLAPEIERGTGSLPRSLEAGYRGVEYDFISATTRATASGDVEIAYTLDTKRARAEIQTVTPQGRLVRDLVTTASSDQVDDPRIGATLFKLLVPVELESFLTGGTDMQIQLDAATAGIPWELLDDGDERRKDQGPWAIRTQLLRKLQLEPGDFRAKVKDAGDDAYALVIGEPQCPDDYGRLPGAREEALGVFESLAAPTALGASVIKLISDDAATAGSDARTIVNTLFERDWRVVHIAGHGALPEAEGSIGGVVLSNGTFLGPAEIKAMRVVPELVFINCCHLGASSPASVLANGHGDKSVYDRTRFAAGVARELIKIGVRCVIAAGWAVDDAAAKDFAQRFYDQLLAGERFIDAVGEARRSAYRREGNTWAAYQCYGDPDWRLRPSTTSASASPPENEFEGVASVATLKLSLETLIVQRTYQGYEAPYQFARVQALAKRWRDAGWSAADDVAELFARAYASVGELQPAIDWYTRAIDVTAGDVSLRALEQRSNLRVRKAWETLNAARRGAPARASRRTRGDGGKTARLQPAIKAARAAILTAMKDLEQLMAFRETVERASLCGSAMKRLAMVEGLAGRPREERQAIAEMERYYQLAEERCVKDGLPNRFYPAGNRLVAELALHAGTKGWKLADRSLIDATRSSLHAKSLKDPDFWSIVGEIDIDLYAALETMTLAAAWPSLERRYHDLYTRMRGGSDWASVYDTAAFLLPKYAERAPAAERAAADAVLTTLERFVPPPSRAARPGGRKPKGKARR